MSQSRPGLFVAAACAWALCAALIVSAPAAPPAPGVSMGAAFDSRRIARDLDAWARPLVDAGQLSGQVLIARGGKEVERDYGFADRERRVRVTPETRFNIASVTKPMTVILAIQLMREKKLGYTDTLERWIPGLPSGNRMTVEHLLRHRSGIPHRVTTEKDETQPMSAAEFVAFARRCTLMFEPGARSSYSSAGFSVLARVLELAGGRTYDQLLHERLLDSLGMSHTSEPDSRVLLPDRALSYVPGPKAFENAPLKDYSFLVGAGSVFSTVGDLNRLVQAVVSGRLGESIRASNVRDGKLSWNGNSNGFVAWADWDSATGTAVVFAGNVHTGATELLRTAARRIAAGETLPPASLPGLAGVTLPDSTLRRVEGVYQLGNGTRLEVRARDGVLWSNDWVMRPLSATRFFSPRDYGDVTAVAGPSGRVERLDWTQSGTVYPAPRIADLPR